MSGIDLLSDFLLVAVSTHILAIRQRFQSCDESTGLTEL